MNIRHALAATVFAAGIMASGSSEAAAVTWDLVNVTFADGGVANGSFTFDASTDTYTSWSITTTATTNPAADNFYPLNGATYTTNNFTHASASYYMNPTSVSFANATDNGFLDFTFAQALTNAGGTVLLRMGSESQNSGFESRSISGGSVSSVPLPASLPLFAVAIVGLAGLGMSRVRASAV